MPSLHIFAIEIAQLCNCAMCGSGAAHAHWRCGGVMDVVIPIPSFIVTRAISAPRQKLRCGGGLQLATHRTDGFFCLSVGFTSPMVSCRPKTIPQSIPGVPIPRLGESCRISLDCPILDDPLVGSITICTGGQRHAVLLLRSSSSSIRGLCAGLLYVCLAVASGALV